jgi:hypothetical protein
MKSQRTLYCADPSAIDNRAPGGPRKSIHAASWLAGDVTFERSNCAVRRSYRLRSNARAPIGGMTLTRH